MKLLCIGVCVVCACVCVCTCVNVIPADNGHSNTTLCHIHKYSTQLPQIVAK